MDSNPELSNEDIHAFVKAQLALVQSGGVAQAPLPVIDFSKFGPIETQALSRRQKLSGKYLQRNWAMFRMSPNLGVQISRN